MNFDNFKPYVVSVGICCSLIAAMYFYSRPSGAERHEPVRLPVAHIENIRYVERELKINAGSHFLGATLTMPTNGQPFAGVVLVAGSGPMDRDSAVSGKRPFAQLAHMLSMNNVAVLRYDKRGVGDSSGEFGTATTDDFFADAVVAFRLLKEQPELVGQPCGVIGHSEGALIGEMMAAKTEFNNLKFALLLAPPGLRGAELLLAQTMSIGNGLELDPGWLKIMTNYLADMCNIVLTESDNAALKREIDIRSKRYVAEATLGGMKEATVRSSVQAHKAVYTSPWGKHFLAIDPTSFIGSVRCPTLMVFGTHDVQVSVDDNLGPITNAIASASVTNINIRILEYHNHLFQKTSSKSIDDYGTLPETMSEEALDTILEWIEAQCAVRVAKTQ